MSVTFTLVQPDARRALDPSDPLVAVERCMADLVQEHGEGFVGEMAQEHLATGGKRTRARLALHACTALGVSQEDAVPWAAACELLHNASLVHDDLQDGDAMRRGRPALWARHGAGQAINAGDLLLMLPTLAIGRVSGGDAVRWRLSSCVARHGARTARGQAQEMLLKEIPDVSFAVYRTAAFGKTAGLFGMPVEGAALLSGHTEDESRRLAAPFEVLGLAYQMLDDVVDLYGDKGRGESGGDVREGKISALVASHLERVPADRVWLMRILRTPRVETTREMVDAVIERMRDSGALKDVLDRIDVLASELEGPMLLGQPTLQSVGHTLRDKLLAPREVLRG